MDLNFKEKSTEEVSENIIKVVGIGGAGNNAVNYMYDAGIKGIDYVVCNTDIQDLENSPVPYQLQIGEKLTEGLGAGSIPQSGKEAAEESEAEIRKMLGGSTKMVILTAGMGGGTGTGATPVVARIAKDMGLVVVAVVTTPFEFEQKRQLAAVEGLKQLENVTDSCLSINNAKLNKEYGDLSFPEACEKANDVLVMAVRSVSEIVTETTAIQNIDYADLEVTLKDSGVAIFGIGKAKGGDDRVGDAFKEALDSPLLDNCNIAGAQKLLVNVVIGSTFTINEKQSIRENIQKRTGAYQEMKLGIRIDENLAEDELVIIIIATKFGNWLQGQGGTMPPFESGNEESSEPEPDEDILKMQRENTQELEEQARKERLAKEKKRQEKQNSDKEEKPKRSKKRKIKDPVGEYKRNKTIQRVFDFFTGDDVDAEM